MTMFHVPKSVPLQGNVGACHLAEVAKVAYVQKIPRSDLLIDMLLLGHYEALGRHTQTCT